MKSKNIKSIETSDEKTDLHLPLGPKGINRHFMSFGLPFYTNFRENENDWDRMSQKI